jgi:hypothetical protein
MPKRLCKRTPVPVKLNKLKDMGEFSAYLASFKNDVHVMVLTTEGRPLTYTPIPEGSKIPRALEPRLHPSVMRALAKMA